MGWRATTAATWIGVIVGLAAVWNASVQIGLSTWWLGPRADQQPRVVQFAPFVPPVLILLATINQVLHDVRCMQSIIITENNSEVGQ